MSDNKTGLWDRLGKTDPEHTKTFKRAGGFSGTAIKPMWSYRRMTEEFGPCGEGWGINEPSFQVVQGENHEVLVYCTVSVWHGSTDKMVFGVGGDKVVTYIKANEQYKRPERWENDDEAFKKAYTDAVTNALKLIGVGADVHMGMFDDNKYVNTVRQEFSEAKSDAKEQPKRASSAQMKKGLDEITRDLMDCHSVVAVNSCAKTWASKFQLEGWTKDFTDEAKPRFAARREALAAKTRDEINDEIPDTIGEIANQFSGARVVDERVQHPLEAGE